MPVLRFLLILVFLLFCAPVYSDCNYGVLIEIPSKGEYFTAIQSYSQMDIKRDLANDKILLNIVFDDIWVFENMRPLKCKCKNEVIPRTYSRKTIDKKFQGNCGTEVEFFRHEFNSCKCDKTNIPNGKILLRYIDYVKGDCKAIGTERSPNNRADITKYEMRNRAEDISYDNSRKKLKAYFNTVSKNLL